MPPVASMPEPYVRGYVIKVGRAMGHAEGPCITVNADCRYAEDVDEVIAVLNRLKSLVENEKQQG